MGGTYLHPFEKGGFPLEAEGGGNDDEDWVVFLVEGEDGNGLEGLS